MISENPMIIAWVSIRKNRVGKLETETLRKKEIDILTALEEIIRAMEVLKYERFERHDSIIFLVKSDPKKVDCQFIIAIGCQPDEATAIVSDPRIKKYLTKPPK